MVFYFICDPAYNCRCPSGKAVSQQTAMSHRRSAELAQISSGQLVHLRRWDVKDPLPRKLPCLPLPVTSQSPNTSLPHDSASENISFAPFTAESSADTLPSGQQSQTPMASIATEQSPVPTSIRYSPAVSSSDSTDLEEACTGTTLSTLDNLPLRGSRDFRFYCFVRRHANLIGISIKHHTTETLMEDLIGDYCANDPPEVRYKSFKGLKKALFRSSGLSTSLHPFCKNSHQALQVNPDNTVMPCSTRGCDNDAESTRSYQYVKLWPQLHARIRSAKFGPPLYEYYHEGLLQTVNMESGEYVDFFSGSNLQMIQERLGGPKSVWNDIFVHLSTDGVQPFGSTKYSYWPVVISIANLPPHERYKMHNMLPVLVIPGPKNPKDVPSFLRPLLGELINLSCHGKVVKMWNGDTRRVRVHLLTVQADLVAMAKLTFLSGVNGISPCRFCFVEGVYVENRRHYYYPHGVYDNVRERRGKRRKGLKGLCDPESLHMRSDHDVRMSYERIGTMISRRRLADARDFAQQIGFSKEELRPTPLLEVPTLFAFSSFPIDIMHLLYCNVAPITVNLWFSADRDLADIAVLSSKSVFERLERSLRDAGTGISSASARKPRGLAERGSWKAAEWKQFVSTTSLVVLHEWIPTHILEGWSLFCRLCHLVEQWRLNERQVLGIVKLARRFFLHFNKHYYKYRKERLHLCRYVYHLLLHLGQSIRANGPISMTAQWSMETLAGVLNDRCNAKDLFAESVVESVKLEAATRMYSIQYDVRIPLLGYFAEIESTVGSHLRCSSNLDCYDGFEMQHPRRETTINVADEQFPRLRQLMRKHYQSKLGMNRDEAELLLNQFEGIVVWERLGDARAANDAPFVYRAFRTRDKSRKERSACYFAGTFAADSGNFIDVWYGKALAFLEHRVGSDVHMLVLAAWATRGLHCAEQLQVYAKKSRSSADTFPVVSVESVQCMSHPVSVFECQVPKRFKGLSVRTYFVDEMRSPNGFMTGRKWWEDVPGMRLQGLVREYERKQQDA